MSLSNPPRSCCLSGLEANSPRARCRHHQVCGACIVQALGRRRLVGVDTTWAASHEARSAKHGLLPNDHTSTHRTTHAPTHARPLQAFKECAATKPITATCCQRVSCRQTPAADLLGTAVASLQDPPSCLGKGSFCMQLCT